MKSSLLILGLVIATSNLAKAQSSSLDLIKKTEAKNIKASDFAKEKESPFVQEARQKNVSNKLKNKLQKSGSEIGGGQIYASLMSWCDDGMLTLEDARREASELWDYDSDSIGAIRALYQGLLNAQATSHAQVNADSSITYRAIVRAIELAQIFGVPDIVNGLGKYNEKQLREVYSLMTFSYDHIKNFAETLDKRLYAPYFASLMSRNHQGVPTVSMVDLERVMTDFTLSQITTFRNKFIATRSDNEGLYPKLSYVKTIRTLGHLAFEAAKDLELSLFNRAYACQIKRLNKYSLDIYNFLQKRRNSSKDGLKLNSFVARIEELVKSIQAKKCF